MMQNIYNGRVNLSGPNIEDRFKMTDRIPVNNKTYENQLIGIFEKNTLSITYFSLDNINIIQDMVRKGVYDKSNGQLTIERQNNDTIVQIMRAYFLQYSKNLDYNIREQISQLNNMVINYCIEWIYNEAISYIKYRHDISTLKNPINHPVLSSKTDKTLELKPWF